MDRVQDDCTSHMPETRSSFQELCYLVSLPHTICFVGVYLPRLGLLKNVDRIGIGSFCCFFFAL